MGQKKGNRRGDVFAVRLTTRERQLLEDLRKSHMGPRGLGPFLVWATEQAAIARVLPPRTGTAALAGVPHGSAPGEALGAAPNKIILDLCAGSGSWSKPYEDAGYNVAKVTLPHMDVRLFNANDYPQAPVHGILAAPPCDQFSLARNGHSSERDFAGALEVVVACLRVIAHVRPVWWALENPVGLLGRWMGPPQDVWQPFEFGDPWTKRTALWGNFAIPERGPFVEPEGSAMDRSTAAERAITPPGFAQAFFKANP